ncbi:MAG: hypothetical protein PHQ23_02775 [Candidatus Wallbacteria bacterium]|nr:hypothetical protein [Candidatus Wallbacteria bacterium]
MKHCTLIFCVVAGLLSTQIYAAQAPSVPVTFVSDYFSLAEDYCQFKIATSTEYEREVFKFMLDQIRTWQTVHLAADFTDGKVWFIQPTSSVHTMTAPQSYPVSDKDLAVRYLDVAREFAGNLFDMKNKLMNITAAELKVRLSDEANASEPRNRVSVYCLVKFQDKECLEFELAEFDGQAAVLFD